MPHSSSAYVGVGSDGEVYVPYRIKLSGDEWVEKGFKFGFTSLYLAVSYDGGKTFFEGRMIAPDTGPDQTERENLHSKNFESFYVTDDGRVYVAWLDSQGTIDGERTPTRVCVTWTDDDGLTFAEPQLVKSVVCQCCATSLCTNSGGDVYVMFRDIMDNPDGMTFRDIVVTKSDDRGSTWSAPERIADDRFEIDGCPHSTSTIIADAEGNLHGAWWTLGGQMPGTYHAKSADGGLTWTEPLLLEGNEWYPATQIKVEVDSENTPVVIWTDRTIEGGAVRYAVIQDGEAETVDLGAGEHPWSDSDKGLTALVWASDEGIMIRSWHNAT